MNRLKLRRIIMEELESLLQDDAIFQDKDKPGITDFAYNAGGEE